MNLQGLTVIFIIIILPMSLILSAYTGSQIQTLRLQILIFQKKQVKQLKRFGEMETT